VCACLSTSISLEPLDRSLRDFVCPSPVAVARSSSGGVAMRYVLPVLWMMSRLAVRRNVEAAPYSDCHERHGDTGPESKCRMSKNACCILRHLQSDRPTQGWKRQKVPVWSLVFFIPTFLSPPISSLPFPFFLLCPFSSPESAPQVQLGI